MRLFGAAFFIIVLVLIGGFSINKVLWGYTGQYDPTHWHELSKDAEICQIGHHQSPINIETTATLDLEQSLKIFYHKAPLQVINNGHTIEFDTTDSHYITLNKKRYDLLQFHFHAHSEHSVDGHFYPAEMHLVHKSSDREIVVLAVQQEMHSTEEDHHIFDKIPEIGGEVSVELDLSSLLPNNKARFVYDGSLTTPPCTENVTWLVFRDPVMLSQKEIDRFKVYYTQNFRPQQKEYLRKVF